jgi:hypothetical protein
MPARPTAVTPPRDNLREASQPQRPSLRGATYEQPPQQQEAGAGGAGTSSSGSSSMRTGSGSIVAKLQELKRLAPNTEVVPAALPDPRDTTPPVNVYGNSKADVNAGAGPEEGAPPQTQRDDPSERVAADTGNSFIEELAARAAENTLAAVRTAAAEAEIETARRMGAYLPGCHHTLGLRTLWRWWPAGGRCTQAWRSTSCMTASLMRSVSSSVRAPRARKRSSSRRRSCVRRQWPTRRRQRSRRSSGSAPRPNERGSR